MCAERRAYSIVGAPSSSQRGSCGLGTRVRIVEPARMSDLPACGSSAAWQIKGRPPSCSNADGMKAPCAHFNGSTLCSCICNPSKLDDATGALPSTSCLNGSSKPSQHFLGTFLLKNVCVRYPNKRSAVAELISRDGNCGDVYGYTEYRLNYARISSLRPPNVGENLRSCQKRGMGLGIRFSSNNFFHQTFYAAAAYQALFRTARMHDAVFVPLGAGYPVSVPTRLWEYTLRSLSNASATQIRQETQALFEEPCTCFDQFLASTHGVDLAHQVSRSSFWAFRRSSLMNAAAVNGVAMPTISRSAQEMLFVMRHTTRRIITNEQELKVRVLEAQPRVRMVAFEEMPVSEQMALVSRSSALIGVHGQALAGYVLFLPTDQQKTACLEIRPQQDPLSWNWIGIVKGLARSFGVKYFALDAPHAPGCNIDKLRHANCTTDVCRRAVSKGLHNPSKNSVLNCNVTVDHRKLLSLINQAADHTSQAL